MNICIVEDNQLLLDGLRILLQGEPDIQVMGTFGSAEDALKHADWSKLHVLLADIDLPGMSGVELIRTVKSQWPDVDAMAYTISEDRSVVMSAIRAGACGYLLKGSTPRVLIESVRELHEGGAPMSPRIARKLLLEIRTDDAAVNPSDAFTSREISIVKLLEQGMSYKEVASELGVSPHTVHSHIKKVYEKVHASSRNEMLLKARKLGVI